MWWGHRIPAYSVNCINNNNNGNVTFTGNATFWIVARSEEEAHARAKEKYGDAVSINQDLDVLDTWFSSAIVPFATLGWPEHVSSLL